MKLPHLTALLAALALGTGCASQPKHSSVEAREPVHHPEFGLITAQPVAGWDVFGADVPDGATVRLVDLVTRPGEFTGKEVVVEAPMEAVCLIKGCWMTFRAGDDLVRVKFKDYAFFLPKDSAGRVARVHGRFEVKEMSKEQVQHYLEDEGKHAEAAAVTGPVKEFTLYASGVRLRQG